MCQPTKEETQARACGLELLKASRIYEGFLIPRSEGRLRPRPFPPHRRAIIGLVGRQRRFLTAAYTLADAGQVLEAIGPLRSMFEFLVCQRWLARDPTRNWKLWMEDDHATRALWRERLSQHAPSVHEAAAAALTAEQLQEQDAIAAARRRLTGEIGERMPDDRRKLEQRADQVGLSFFYDVIYRYESSAAVHPTMFAVDLLLEGHPEGLRLRGEPSAQFAPPPIFLHGAFLLYEALRESGELTRALRLKQLPSIGAELHALAERCIATRLPNWQNLLPPDVRG